METVTFLFHSVFPFFPSLSFSFWGLCFKCFLVQCSMPVCIFEPYFSTFAGKKKKDIAHSNEAGFWVLRFFSAFSFFSKLKQQKNVSKITAKFWREVRKRQKRELCEWRQLDEWMRRTLLTTYWLPDLTVRQDETFSLNEFTPLFPLYPLSWTPIKK